MAYRQFTDSRGVRWDVWDVEPSHAERRLLPDRRRVARPGPDRRRGSTEARVRINTELVHGWLAFESKHERRRLAPAPDDWESLDDAALEQLLERALSLTKPRRLIE